MSTSSISAAAPLYPSDKQGLVKTASGTFTAASVEANPRLAAGLIRLKNGEYGQPIVAASDRYTAGGGVPDLSGLKLGG